MLYESNTCLKPKVTPWAARMLRLHRHYKNGVLLNAGGLMDQPETYLRAMELIDSYL